MRTLILVTLITTLAACNSNGLKQTSGSVSMPLKNTSDSMIAGTWTMCSTLSDSLITQMNVCSVISFMDNGEGMVKYSSFIEFFHWNYAEGLQKGKLSIFYNQEYDSKLFTDSVYYTAITKKGGSTTLTINDGKHNSFYLSR